MTCISLNVHRLFQNKKTKTNVTWGGESVGSSYSLFLKRTNTERKTSEILLKSWGWKWHQKFKSDDLDVSVTWCDGESVCNRTDTELSRLIPTILLMINFVLFLYKLVTRCFLSVTFYIYKKKLSSFCYFQIVFEYFGVSCLFMVDLR